MAPKSLSPQARIPRRTERGATLVEFAMAFPVLILLMMGVVDFGVNFGNKVQTTHAAREAARAGSVGKVGTTTTCPMANPATGFHTAELVCYAKGRTHIDPEYVRVRVAYMDGNGQYTNDFSVPSRVANKYSILVCLSSRAYSLSGMLNPVFDGRFNHSRAVIKTGQTPWPEPAGASTAYKFIDEYAETPMAGDNWSWCASDDPAQDVAI